MTPRDVRARAAIVGVAEAGVGSVPTGTTPADVMAEASAKALKEAGISVQEVEAVFTASTQMPMPAMNLVEYMGMTPRYHDSSQLGGASFIAQLGHAAAMIAAGYFEVALIAYGSTQRLIGRSAAARQELTVYEEPFRPRLPLVAYALAASRHMHAYGTTREDLASVAVTTREWARRNDWAWRRDPLTVQDALAARMVAYPFTVEDCCVVTDGGGALVVTDASTAESLPSDPVYVLGVGESVSHRYITNMPDLTTTAAVQSGSEAYAMAGLGPTDVDVAELYDAFSITPILFLEDLGFCRKGEGGPFVADGNTAPDGLLPMNTNGGGLSYCHPGLYGIFLLTECVRQVRGDAGGRQVPNCEVGLVHGNGGVLSAQATAILGSVSTV